jgi:hypothetical protein
MENKSKFQEGLTTHSAFKITIQIGSLIFTNKKGFKTVKKRLKND